MISPLLTRPQRCQGCQKIRKTKLKTTLVSWSAIIQPKLNKFWKPFRKQGFFDNFCSILTGFHSFFNFGWILALQLRQFSLFFATLQYFVLYTYSYLICLPLLLALKKCRRASWSFSISIASSLTSPFIGSMLPIPELGSIIWSSFETLKTFLFFVEGSQMNLKNESKNAIILAYFMTQSMCYSHFGNGAIFIK